MNILLIYPTVTETFWSFKHALKVVRRKAAFPPLGALTVAAMLPTSWAKRLVDLNVMSLRDEDILWADYVFISAMIAQKDSAEEVIDRCRMLGVKTVAGGPLFRAHQLDFPHVDHFVIGEGEATIRHLVDDLTQSKPKPVYEAPDYPDLTGVPTPLWDLIDLNDYSAMSVQYSRGCPFNCEFCDIIIMNGRVPRTKTIEQVLRELDALYDHGWRNSVFIVDDNFIGNKEKVKRLLRAVIEWQNAHGRPFSFYTEASVNLAEDEELMRLMVKAGFNKVFIGLETPSKESLQECGKSQNLKKDLGDSVRTIQDHGLAVMGGFIIGFDNDPPDIFQRQVNFIQNNGIVTAMIGLLTAIPGTRLYQRLEAEGRLLFQSSGNNTDVDGSLNFIPTMDRERIIDGYRWVMSTIYSPEMYYKRIRTFLRQYRPAAQSQLNDSDLLAFIRSLWYLGIADREGNRGYYWRLLEKTFFRYRKSFSDVVTVSIYGYHFRKLFSSSNSPQSSEDWKGGRNRNLPRGRA